MEKNIGQEVKITFMKAKSSFFSVGFGSINSRYLFEGFVLINSRCNFAIELVLPKWNMHKLLQT